MAPWAWNTDQLTVRGYPEGVSTKGSQYSPDQNREHFFLQFTVPAGALQRAQRGKQ